ncbi:hypothetical protein S245_058888 [Arachis hypogaea]
MLLVQAPKKKVKKANIPVAEVVYGAMEQVDLQKAVEKEFEMALQDRVMEETKYKKNAVEAYVYEMRNKMRLIFSLFLPNFKYKCPLFDVYQSDFFCYHFSLMTNIKILSLLQRGKIFLLDFSRWKTGYMRMVKTKLKAYCET